MPQRLALMTIVCLLAALTGCATYRVGNLNHPQLKTIAVGSVENETREPMLDTVLKQKLPASVMTDGSMRLAPSDSADAVINAKVLSVRVSTKGTHKLEKSNGEDSEQIYRSSLYGVEVMVEYAAYRPGRAEPVVGPQRVKGRGVFQDEADLAQSRQMAIKAALADAADQIVSGITEGF